MSDKLYPKPAAAHVNIAAHLAQDPLLFSRQESFSQYHLEQVEEDMNDEYLDLYLPQQENDEFAEDCLKQYEQPSEHQFLAPEQPWHRPLKEEPKTEEYVEDVAESHQQQSSSQAGPMRISARRDTLTSFVPKTTARKYTQRPDHEKKTDQYKIKRERNNDAVRRSRTKAKIEQQKRDEELQALKQEMESLRKQNQTLVRKMANCRCQRH